MSFARMKIGEFQIMGLDCNKTVLKDLKWLVTLITVDSQLSH